MWTPQLHDVRLNIFYSYVRFPYNTFYLLKKETIKRTAVRAVVEMRGLEYQEYPEGLRQLKLIGKEDLDASS